MPISLAIAGSRRRRCTHLAPLFVSAVLLVPGATPAGQGRTHTTIASWYGEAHRGKLMANGKRFDPERLTAASWFYALGTRLRVSCASRRRSVIVTITDRGPALDLVRDGRSIDLSRAAFRRLAATDEGLVEVKIEHLK